ncbi:MAG: M23 family metallopeptidase [Clostridia bacterium]|nr:M23 family metallopeptidase [Clostridia bacterium]
MSEKAPNPILNFVRKNLYYLLVGVSLIIIATVITVVAVQSNKSSTVSKRESTTESNESVTESTKESNKTSEKESSQSSEKESTSGTEKTSESEKPVDKKIVFCMPVLNATIIKDYTSATVVYNKTLGVYTGHMGIDFGANAGEKVVATYDGRVESIVTTYLQGTTITVDHGNGLKSVYNSLDADENLREGQSVKQGQTLGFVSDNNLQEYKDGAHLHFEVTLNGEKVDPAEYIMLNEK